MYAAARMAAIVRKVDHILLSTPEVRPLFSLFSETLGLPVAWPLFPYLQTLSGAVSLGRVNLEVLEPLPGNAGPIAGTEGTQLVGLAFEPPTVEVAVRELEARGLTHEAPWQFKLNDWVSWTSVPLRGMPGCPVQLLVKYNRDQDARWREFESALEQREGGKLGVLGLDEIVVEATDSEAAPERWDRLLAPAPFVSGRWELESGPAIRLERGREDRLAALMLRVRSVARACDALAALGLLAPGGPPRLHLAERQAVDLLLRE